MDKQDDRVVPMLATDREPLVDAADAGPLGFLHAPSARRWVRFRMISRIDSYEDRSGHSCAIAHRLPREHQQGEHPSWGSPFAGGPWTQPTFRSSRSRYRLTHHRHSRGAFRGDWGS